jgi:hypothetical protein
MNNEEIKGKVSEFQRRANLMVLLFGYLGSKNNAACSESKGSPSPKWAKGDQNKHLSIYVS